MEQRILPFAMRYLRQELEALKWRQVAVVSTRCGAGLVENSDEGLELLVVQGVPFRLVNESITGQPEFAYRVYIPPEKFKSAIELIYGHDARF